MNFFCKITFLKACMIHICTNIKKILLLLKIITKLKIIIRYFFLDIDVGDKNKII